MIEVEQTTNENGKVSFIISWDENDPQESIFNTFTEQDFIDTLMYYCEQERSKLTYTEYAQQQSKEAYVYDDEEDEYEYYHQENNEAQ
jgi:hypothetical protein